MLLRKICKCYNKINRLYLFKKLISNCWGERGAIGRGTAPSGVLENFEVTHPFCRHSVALGSTLPLTERVPRGIPGGKLRPARRAENSAILVEPECQNNDRSPIFCPHLSLHALLRECFVFKTATLKGSS